MPNIRGGPGALYSTLSKYVYTCVIEHTIMAMHVELGKKYIVLRGRQREGIGNTSHQNCFLHFFEVITYLFLMDYLSAIDNIAS